MSIFQHEPSRHSQAEVIADWWRDRAHNVACPADLAACSPDDIGQMAWDVGLTTYDLQRLVRHGSHAADLLLRRMAALDLDREEIAEADRAALLDLQRVCTSCASKRRCRRDLARRPDDRVWQDYCPNVATLKMLEEEQPWWSRREW